MEHLTENKLTKTQKTITMTVEKAATWSVNMTIALHASLI